MSSGNVIYSSEIPYRFMTRAGDYTLWIPSGDHCIIEKDKEYCIEFSSNTMEGDEEAGIMLINIQITPISAL